MEPVRNLVVGILLPGAVQVLVQFLELPLHTLAPACIACGLRQEKPVLEVHDLRGHIDLHHVHDVFPNILPAVEDRLHSSGVPVQELHLEHVLDVIDKSGVKLVYDVVFRDLVICGIDIQTPKHVISDDGRVIHFVFNRQTASLLKTKRGASRLHHANN